MKKVKQMKKKNTNVKPIFKGIYIIDKYINNSSLWFSGFHFYYKK